MAVAEKIKTCGSLFYFWKEVIECLVFEPSAILFFTRRRKEPREHKGKMRLLFENIVQGFQCHKL
jgi:hypothetical protein